MAKGMPSLRARVDSVASALVNFDSGDSRPFTAATILSSSASAASVMAMARLTHRNVPRNHHRPDDAEILNDPN
jgi:hypothetical protein